MDALPAPREAPPSRTLKLLSANIQAGSATRRYSDYVTRSWSYALPSEIKRRSLDLIARMASRHDIVGLQEADPGSLRSGFTNQTHYLAERGAKDVTAINIIAAPEGIKYVEEHIDPSIDFKVVVCAVDERLNDKCYIVPGLGDAGDLSFGEKISLR